MKKLLVSILTVSLLLSILIILPPNRGVVCAEVEGFESNLTNDSLPQGKPTIYGDRVVWTENTLEGGKTNWEIFLYDLSIDSDNDGVPNYKENSTTGGKPVPDPAKIRITNNASRQLGPKIYNDIIVWEDDRYGNWDIFMYDLSMDSDEDGIPNYLDDDDDDDGILDINDLNGDPAEIRVTDHPAHQENPSIYDEKIVWEDSRYGNKDVYLFDIWNSKEIMLVGLNETQDPKDRPWQTYPRIYGDKVVWQDELYGNLEICMYNLSVDTDGDGVPNYLDDDRTFPDLAQERITSNSVSDYRPFIYCNYITYSRSDNIFLYDITSFEEYQITDSSSGQKIDSGPCIYGTKIVWSYEEGSKDLYLYDLGMDSDDDGKPNYIDDDDDIDLALMRITNQSERFSMIPSIYANRIVWQDSRIINKQIEIFLFTLTDNIPPKIEDFSPRFNPEITEQESYNFTVTASDPENNPLTYKWFLDNLPKQGGNTNTFEYISDLVSSGVHEIRVIVSDGEYPVEKVWLIQVAESGIPILKITNMDPLTNPAITEGGEISLSMRVRYLGSEVLSAYWTWDQNITPAPSNTNTTSDTEAYGELSFFSPLDYYGSNYVEYFNFTFEVTDGKHAVSHTWYLTVLFFDDADMDGYSDYKEMMLGYDPLDRTSKPIDSDCDLIVDIDDEDTDGDGFLDEYDGYALNPQKQLDGNPDISVEILIVIISLILLVIAIIALLASPRSRMP